MAGFGEAVVLVTAISQCASEIQQLGNNYYKATVEWKQFPRQVEELEERLKFWETECRNRGLSSEATIIILLSKAKLLLEEEQTKLQKRVKSCGSGCWSRSITTVFPARLGQSIQGTTDAIYNILGRLTSQEETKCTLDRLVQAKSFSERIPHDARYVPLKVSETEVYEALENPNGPHVVLLHGGAGKGKSTLARYTAVQYMYKKKSEQPRFDHVFFLNCGPNAKVEETLFELIQRLGSDPAARPEENFGTLSIRMRKQIRGLLQVQKVLIILDDVSNGEFLVDIVRLCGNQVKCLVTSQLATLCGDTLRSGEFLNIKIQDVELEDARNILANHVGVLNQQIPENVQELVDNLILETESNPLALASLANAIDPKRYTDLKEWENASTNFFHALHEEVRLAVFDSKYQRSFWSTTRMSIDSLRPDSQNLLFLIHACQGPSIPEEVVQLLYEGLILKLQMSKVMFSIVRRELESKELIKMTTREVFGNVSSGNNVSKQQRSWSIHSLHKLYIEEEMTKEKDLIFTCLAKMENETTNMKHTVGIKCESNEVETKVLIALCALYLDGALGTMAAQKMGVSTKIFNTIRRQAIEPIVLLLALPLICGQWTNADQASTREVFLQYICNDALDDSNISHLLTVEVGAMAMCTALRNIAFLGRSRTVDKNNEGLMTTLVHWLDEGVVPYKQEAALEVLNEFILNTPNKMFIGYFPGVLENIALLLQEAPSKAISSHNYATQTSTYHQVVIPEVVNTASNVTNTKLQAQAARALANLGHRVVQMKVKIVEHPRVLVKLVDSLSIETNTKLQVEASRALINLARGPNDIKEKIANHQGALFTLVGSLSHEANPNLQWNCAWALANLAKGSYDIKVKIIEYPGALLKLVELLSVETNAELQAQVARALANLACGVDEMKAKIANHPGALIKLVNLLSIETNAKSQANAALAISNLAEGPNDIKEKIANHKGSLFTLVRSLSNEANPNLQWNCAYALANLAKGSYDIKVKIVEHPEALLRLVESLSFETNVELQAQVAQALANLACGVVDIKAKIAAHSGAFVKLLKLLSNKGNAKVQQEAARAMTFLNPMWENVDCEHIPFGKAYVGRAIANFTLGHLKEALGDLEHAHELEPEDLSILRYMFKVKAKMEDYEGALVDADNLVNSGDDVNQAFDLQERGVLKRIMGDLDGALADLNEGLALETDDYERLKHRGYVKFLMGDAEGAQGDAECALRIKPSHVDNHGYGKKSIPCLGVSSVEYLGYMLK